MKKWGPSHRRKRSKRSMTLETMFYRQRGQCYYCKRTMMLHGSGAARATRDHVVPRANGGKQANNLVAACDGCNSRKGSMSAAEFKATVLQGHCSSTALGDASPSPEKNGQ